MEEPNLKLTLQAWTDIVIKIWKEKIIKQNIRSSNELFLSFASTIQSNADGNPEKIIFAFQYYGKFVDMGVGKGVTLETYNDMVNAGLTNRRKKPWFLGTFEYQVEKLAEIMEEKYATKIATAMVNSLEEE